MLPRTPMGFAEISGREHLRQNERNINVTSRQALGAFYANAATRDKIW
jgi:hypothetical protein